MAFAIIEEMVESEDTIFDLYTLYKPHPIAANPTNSTTYVATANLCNAGMAAGVIIRLLFFAYAKNVTAMARKPIRMSARYDRPTFCFSTCPKSLP